ncbi:MAG: hypothetical protein PHP93_08805 [Kiritimatiellales bacterium]|nr:hypothetical protein [Kiritimatiellales bacterium]
MKHKWIRLTEWIENTPYAFLCVAVSSFLWSTAAVPFLSLHHDGIRPFFSPVNKGNQDLAQYYMGGAVVLESTYESMYPDALENIQANVGWPKSFILSPFLDGTVEPVQTAAGSADVVDLRRSGLVSFNCIARDEDCAL